MAKKYKYNNQYFSNTSVQNSYWGGFIAADGNISKNRLTICVKRDDRIILENFKSHIDFIGKIHDIEQIIYSNQHKFKKNQYPQSRIRFTSKDFCKDLNNHFNITPKKSLTLKPPNLTDKNEILSYIIGYIDGDGCITTFTTKRQPNSYHTHLYIISTKEVLEWINNVLSNTGTITSISTNTYKLRYSGKKCRDIIKLLKDFAIENNLPILSRKWDKINLLNFPQ